MDNRIQKCIIINKGNLDVIEEGLENIDLSDTRKISVTPHSLIETKRRIREIKDVIDIVEEVKICWG